MRDFLLMRACSERDFLLMHACSAVNIWLNNTLNHQYFSACLTFSCIYCKDVVAVLGLVSCFKEDQIKKQTTTKHVMLDRRKVTVLNSMLYLFNEKKNGYICTCVYVL